MSVLLSLDPKIAWYVTGFLSGMSTAFMISVMWQR